MKTSLLSIILLLGPYLGYSQSSYSIKGSLADTSGAPLPFTSVLLLAPTDSSLITFAKADDKGNFLFNNIKKQDYLVKSTYVGYLPNQIFVKYQNQPVKDLGVIKLKIIQKELFEVVIRTAKAPLTIKGDTIEYDASKFKVPPGSTVEDLLKRLPGIQIDAEGNIKAQGKEVKKVLVDGKRFFGDDPKQATKNLPSDAISKVQIFNDTSEQTKLTGVDDGKKEKTVNLELKEEFKKGGFGKGTVGAGTEERVMAKFNYNKFDAKNQFAILGFGNNINQSGLSNNDFQDFRGSQSYNWNDNADFGFSSSGSGRIYYFSDSDEGTDIPRSWGPGKGLSNNYAGGVNYNYDTKKTKFSSNYFYSNSIQNINQFVNSQRFLPDFNYFLNENSRNRNNTSNHRISLRFEKQLDSLNTLLININSKYGIRNNIAVTNSEFLNAESEKFRSQSIENDFLSNNLILSSSLVYRHKFKKKGRSFAMSGSFNKNNNDLDSSPRSAVEQFKVTGRNFQLGKNDSLNIAQNIGSNTQTNELKSSVLFIEPLSKKVFLEAFYNIKAIDQLVDRQVANSLDIRQRIPVDSLSNYFLNDINSNRVGSSIRYNFKGVNLSVGLAAQRINIAGEYFNRINTPKLNGINNSYDALLPNVSLNLELKNNKFLNFSYEKNFNEPKIKDLQPIKDLTNPLFIKEGNPNLLPNTSHVLSGGYGLYDPVRFINIWSNVSYAYYKNQVVYNQIVNDRLLTTIRPQNVSGGQNINYYFNFGFPIKKTKVSASIDTYGDIGKNPIYINNVLNLTQNNSYNVNFRLDLTPKDWFSLFMSLGSGGGGNKYSDSKIQNQNFTNQNANLNFVMQMPKLIFLTADFNYSGFRNKTSNFDQKVPILNISAYKVIGKAKKSEIRLSLYDVFKRNLGINQTAFQNEVTSTVTQTLSRYIMLSYTYNMRGITAKVKKSRWN